MQSDKQQKKPSKSKVTPANTKAFAAKNQQSDEYKTSKDYIWGDVIRHERVLGNNWNQTWLRRVEDESQLPYFYPQGTDKKRQAGIPHKSSTDLSFYKPQPSAGIPLKASEVIGWRVTDPRNLMDFFKTPYLPHKVKFVQEQYGFYRNVKYHRDALKNKDSDKDEGETQMPQKFIRPIIKRILC